MAEAFKDKEDDEDDDDEDDDEDDENDDEDDDNDDSFCDDCPSRDRDISQRKSSPKSTPVENRPPLALTPQVALRRRPESAPPSRSASSTWMERSAGS